MFLAYLIETRNTTVPPSIALSQGLAWMVSQSMLSNHSHFVIASSLHCAYSVIFYASLGYFAYLYILLQTLTPLYVGDCKKKIS